MTPNQLTLLEVMDFSRAQTIEAVWNQARLIATELLTNWEIHGLKGGARIKAIEFYLHIPGLFEDNASHNRLEQLSRGKFYFHTKSKGEKWSPPIFNRHGVDITCGNKERGIFAGILLRHLGMGNNHRDGSGLALRSLVRGAQGFEKIKPNSEDFGWKSHEIELFKKLNHESIFEHEIKLVHNPLSPVPEIVALPRVGIAGTRFASELLRFSVT